MKFKMVIFTNGERYMIDDLTREEVDFIIYGMKSNTWVDFSKGNTEYHFRSFSISFLSVEAEA